jgi:putative polyhydroxyalkanoate system protein
MSDIDIRRNHSLPMARARKHAEQMARALREKFDLESVWEGNVLRFSRTGVSGALTVSETHVRIEAKLGLLLGFLKPQIENHIHENLDEIFAVDAPTGAKAVASPKPATAKGTAKSDAKSAAKPAKPKR